jgi:hypothetical protein
MEHTVHLAAGDFIKAISPMETSSRKAAGKKRKHTDDDEVDEDNEDDIEESSTPSATLDEDQDMDELPDDWAPGDILSKLLAFIKQVIGSLKPLHLTFVSNACSINPGAIVTASSEIL